MISAKVIKDSISPAGKRITTFELEYPRFIHSELMTHRAFSKNSASSRAIPVPTMLKMVWNNPAMPVHWGKYQKGMTADEELNGLRLWMAKKLWVGFSRVSCAMAWLLWKVGLAKQLTNRLIEWCGHIKIVLTGTEFENFFHLRRHKDAQPEIHALADVMFEAREQSVPDRLEIGQWHLPYIERGHFGEDDEFRYYLLDENGTSSFITLEDALRISSSLCAQISYRKVDDSIEKALAIYNRLVNSTPVHCYDEHTEVLTESGFKFWRDVLSDDKIASFDPSDGKFIQFEIPDKLIVSDYVGKMYNYEQKDFSLSITPAHNLYGLPIRNWADRAKEDYILFKANGKTSSKAKYSTFGEVSFKNPLCSSGVKKRESDNHSEYNLGQFIGMFVGDGHLPTDYRHTVKFHFKKQRKIDYILKVISDLTLKYDLVQNKDGTTTITVVCPDKVNPMDYYDQQKNKKIPYIMMTHDMAEGIFDGLMNSDGSKKRKGYVYSTSSPTLVTWLEMFFPLYGFGSTSSYKSKKNNYKIYIRNKKYAIVNDSRRTHERVKIEDYNGKVYCAQVSHGLLMIRRKGNTCLSGNSSPFEHQATPLPDPDTCSGNFIGWMQHRQIIQNNVVRG
jgi:hypothetical protein